MLFPYIESTAAQPPRVSQSESLLRYTFRQKTVLSKAITIEVYPGDKTGRAKNNLQLLGQAVYDFIVITRLYAIDPPLSHEALHRLKTALVHNDFISFIFMDPLVHNDLISFIFMDQLYPDTQGELVDITERWPHSILYLSNKTHISHNDAIERLNAIKYQVRDDFQHRKYFPWALLARLRPDTLHYHASEAILGAYWADSGSMEVCEATWQGFGFCPI